LRFYAIHLEIHQKYKKDLNIYYL